MHCHRIVEQRVRHGKGERGIIVQNKADTWEKDIWQLY